LTVLVYNIRDDDTIACVPSEFCRPGAPIFAKKAEELTDAARKDRLEKIIAGPADNTYIPTDYNKSFPALPRTNAPTPSSQDTGEAKASSVNTTYKANDAPTPSSQATEEIRAGMGVAWSIARRFVGWV
jgi:hypothetical protein